MTQKTSHRKLRSISGFLLLFFWTTDCFYHYGEVNQKHAAEMPAVCDEWWGLTAKLLTITSRRCFCGEAWSQCSRLGIWTMTAKGKAHCFLLPPLDPNLCGTEKTSCSNQDWGRNAVPDKDIDVSVPWNALDTIKSMKGTMAVLQHEEESVVGLLIVQYVSKHFICGCLNIDFMVVFSL